MADSWAKIDVNNVPSLTAVTDDANQFITRLLVDPTTGRLLVSAAGAVGDVTGPATNTDNYIPQWDGTNSNTLKNGLPVTNWLQIDQTTPQTVINGTPIFNVGLKANALTEVSLNSTAITHLTGTAFAIVGADNATVRLGMSSFGIGGTNAYANRHARGTAASPSAVQNGDQLVSLEGWGYGATGYSVSSKVMLRGYSAETWTDLAQGSKISLWTTPIGSIVPAERIKISDAGVINIPNLTASKVVFTDALSNLTSTGIGTSAQFIKGDGSLDSSTYLTSVGTGTANEITYWSGTNTLGSLTTATYPSLTELSYVKSVTSSIQTQLNGKQASGSYALTTGTLAQFASTTSAQLAGVVSDETGTGVLVFGTSPTLTTPLIGTIKSALGDMAIDINVPSLGVATILGSTSITALELGPNAGAEIVINATNTYPLTNDGNTLGEATHNWSDLFLASGGVINWNNGNATITHSTGLLTSNVPLSLGTSNAFTTGTIELGHATDTTISRVSAGVIAVEGVTVDTISATNTLTNKRINPRIVSAASYTTDTGTSLDISTCDEFVITAQAGALKFNNPGGTPVQGNKLIIRIKDNGTARALTYDTQFRAIGVTLPTTTVLSKTLYMGFIYNSDDTKWDCVATAQEA